MAQIESGRLARAALAALGVAVLISGYPAWAGDASDQARSECKQLLHEKGFKDVDVGDLDSRDDGNKIVVSVSAEKKGKNRDVSCVYDRDSGKAKLSS